MEICDAAESLCAAGASTRNEVDSRRVVVVLSG